MCIFETEIETKSLADLCFALNSSHQVKFWDLYISLVYFLLLSLFVFGHFPVWGGEGEGKVVIKDHRSLVAKAKIGAELGKISGIARLFFQDHFCQAQSSSTAALLG